MTDNIRTITIPRLFQLSVETVIPFRFYRFGLTVRIPFTGTIRCYGFDR